VVSFQLSLACDQPNLSEDGGMPLGYLLTTDNCPLKSLSSAAGLVEIPENPEHKGFAKTHRNEKEQVAIRETHPVSPFSLYGVRSARL
jgi:hypothetical protein